ncbi:MULTISPECIES: thiamine phosphate synthase [Acinetobacter]|uniref:NUDIX domain-containing protein n=1 Tax=Acinetobacter TaxID=469 RepID=UPI0014447E99|nr:MULTISPECIES: thiamine phosphate synthase [Acinetobacter]MDM1487224.1 thiamine phosphate synthase [Acinetobacter towneri]
MFKPTIHVAIALLFHQNKVLVGWREAKQHQGNKHEFPGGKVEAGESPVAACRREVFEEVGIGLQHWHDFDVICHEYDDVIVNLHIFHAAVPTALLKDIQVPWAWFSRSQLLDLNFPQANRAILQRLVWPKAIKISEDLSLLSSLPKEKLLYWRVEPTAEQKMELIQYCVEQLGQVIINLELWKQLNPMQQQAVAAIHLKQSQLMQLQKGDLKVGLRYIAACHDIVSAQHAQQIGCEAILLSPVLPTATHTDATALGWEKFQQITELVDIPVFALGGLTQDDLAVAEQHHAYGIAGVRFI